MTRTTLTGGSRTLIALLLVACVGNARATALAQSGIRVLEPCASRVIVRNASPAEHYIKWVDPASGERVVHRVPPHARQPFSYSALALRIPPGVALEIDGRVSTHARSSVPCVRPLPANAPDSIPDDYSHLNATIPSLIPGMRFPGIVMLSFNTNVTPAQRDSIVFAERLELVGGARIGSKGYGIWAFWIPDDSVASNARALAARLNQMPAIRSAMLNGLRRDVPNSPSVPFE